MNKIEINTIYILGDHWNPLESETVKNFLNRNFYIHKNRSGNFSNAKFIFERGWGYYWPAKYREQTKFSRIILQEYFGLVNEIYKFKFQIKETTLNNGSITKKDLLLYKTRNFDNLTRRIEKIINENKWENKFYSQNKYWLELIKELISDFNDKLKKENLNYYNISLEDSLMDEIENEKVFKDAIFVTTFGEGHETVFEHLKNNLLKKDIIIRKINLSSGETLSTGIRDEIRNCKNFIVDISLYDYEMCKENVPYELGLIRGQQKNHIVICKRKDWEKHYKKSNFSDISGEMVKQYSEQNRIYDLIVDELEKFE